MNSAIMNGASSSRCSRTNRSAFPVWTIGAFSMASFGSCDQRRHLYRARNLVERFFNKIKQCRRIATRYDKLAANYLAFIKLASIRIWLRAYESAPKSTSARTSFTLTMIMTPVPFGDGTVPAAITETGSWTTRIVCEDGRSS